MLRLSGSFKELKSWAFPWYAHIVKKGAALLRSVSVQAAEHGPTTNLVGTWHFYTYQRLEL